MKSTAVAALRRRSSAREDASAIELTPSMPECRRERRGGGGACVYVNGGIEEKVRSVRVLRWQTMRSPSRERRLHR
jgi:hypothetical protein